MADVVDLTGSDGQCNSEDEQLKKAIQLSLQQDEPCDQDLDSGDEQMKLAIRLSLEQPDTKPSLKRQASPDMFDLNKKAKLSRELLFDTPKRLLRFLQMQKRQPTLNRLLSLDVLSSPKAPSKELGPLGSPKSKVTLQLTKCYKVKCLTRLC